MDHVHTVSCSECGVTEGTGAVRLSVPWTTCILCRVADWPTSRHDGLGEGGGGRVGGSTASWSYLC